jgi:formylmethanofuran dehydrogenase subunit D
LDLKQLNIAFDKNNFEQSNKIINVCGSGEDIFTLSLETGNVISLKSETGEVVALVKTTHQSSDIRKKGTKYTIVFKENYQLSN